MMIDAKYIERYNAIVSVFIHPKRLESADPVPLGGTPYVGLLKCAIDGLDVKNQRLIENPHDHTLVLVCPIPTNVTTIRTEFYSLTIWDELSPHLLRFHLNVSVRDSSGLFSAAQRKHRLISCSSPLSGQGRFLMEWIEYHILKGVNFFYIYGWAAEQRILDVVRLYAPDAKVVFIEYTLPLAPNHAHYQVPAQAHCLHMFGQNAEYVPVGFRKIDNCSLICLPAA
jgi:hypothetical protein